VLEIFGFCPIVAFGTDLSSAAETVRVAYKTPAAIRAD
jgi:hypothetical protein